MTWGEVRRLARWALSLAFVVLLVAFGWTVEWRATWDALTGASAGLLVAATLVNLVSLVGKAAIWWLFLRPIGVRSLALALRATIAGAALSNIAPANAGDAARAVMVARTARVPASAVVAALAMERLLDGMGLVALLVLAPLVITLPESIARWHAAAAAVLAVMIIVVVLAIASDVPTPRERHVRSLFDHVHRLLARFVADVSAAATMPRVAWGLVISLVSWATQVATYHLTALALHFPVTPAGTLAILLAENVAFAVRVTPGSVGVFQLIYGASAVALGLPRAHAIAVALVLQALQIVPVTVLGLVLTPHLLRLSHSARESLEL